MGGPSGNQTHVPVVASAMVYQLSYTGGITGSYLLMRTMSGSQTFPAGSRITSIPSWPLGLHNRQWSVHSWYHRDMCVCVDGWVCVWDRQRDRATDRRAEVLSMCVHVFVGSWVWVLMIYNRWKYHEKKMRGERKKKRFMWVGETENNFQIRNLTTS